MTVSFVKEVQDNATIRTMIMNDPEQVIGIIEDRVRTIDYLADKNGRHTRFCIRQSKSGNLAILATRQISSAPNLSEVGRVSRPTRIFRFTGLTYSRK